MYSVYSVKNRIAQNRNRDFAQISDPDRELPVFPLKKSRFFVSPENREFCAALELNMQSKSIH